MGTPRIRRIEPKDSPNETLTCQYTANGENRLLLGPPSVGKTHLAIAFALEALTQGYSVLFLTTADLVAECHKAEAKGTVSRLIKKWTRPDLIVLDEVGYFPFDEFSANIFSKSSRRDMSSAR